MPWDRKRLLGYVETIQLILGVTDKFNYIVSIRSHKKFYTTKSNVNFKFYLVKAWY